MTNNESRKENDYGDIGLTKLLTPANVADILGISVKTVNKLVREGKLGCVQVTAKERRLSEEQIREYIESRSSKVQIDRRITDRVKSVSPKGGEKSSRVFNRADLLKEIRSWQ
jgi:excisionase family DNA binding protein